MERLIPYKIISRFIEIPLSKKKVYQLLSDKYQFVSKENDHIDSIIDKMKQATQVSLYLSDNQIPEAIIEEASWLEYYGFYINVYVETTMLFEQYREKFKQVQIVPVERTRIEISQASNTYIYLLGNTICEIRSFGNILDLNKYLGSVKKDTILLVPKSNMDFKKCFKSTKLDSFSLYDINDPDLEKKLKDNIAINNGGNEIEKPLLITPQHVYWVSYREEKYYLEEVMNVSALSSIYLSTKDGQEKVYVTSNNQMIPLEQKEPKLIHLEYQCKTMTDYLQNEVNIDEEKIILENVDYSLIELSIKVYPPLIKDMNNVKLAEKYQEILPLKSIMNVLREKLKDYEGSVLNRGWIPGLFQKVKDLKISGDLHEFMVNMNELKCISESIGNVKKELMIWYQNLCSNSDFMNSNSNEDFDTIVNEIEDNAFPVANLKSTLSRVVEIDTPQSSEHERKREFKMIIYLIYKFYRTLYELFERIKELDVPSLGLVYLCNSIEIILVKYQEELNYYTTNMNRNQYQIYYYGGTNI